MAPVLLLTLLLSMQVQAAPNDDVIVLDSPYASLVKAPFQHASTFKPTPYRWIPYVGDPLDYKKKNKAKLEAVYIEKLQTIYGGAANNKADSEATYIARLKAAYKIKPSQKTTAFHSMKGTPVRLNATYGVSVDHDGNVYIADYTKHRVRKLSAIDGSLTTVAGTGVAGYSGDDGAAVEAKLKYPFGVSVDSSGNLYIADYGNNRVRKVSAIDGIITTVAGIGVAGFSGDHGEAVLARLNYPIAVAVDSFDNVYIADYLNNRIRKVSALDDIITTVAGTGIPGYSGDYGDATMAMLNYPIGISVDSFDELYIADYANHRIRKISGDGMIKTVAGMGSPGYSGDGASAAFAELNYPFGLSFDNSDNLYIADYANHHIRKVSAIDGVISTVAGSGKRGYSGDSGDATAAQLNYPIGVSVDRDGDLYIADYWNNRIRKLSTVDGTITTIAGTGVSRYYTDVAPDPSFDPAVEKVDNNVGVLQVEGTELKLKRVRKAFGLRDGLGTTVFSSTIGSNPDATHTSTKDVTSFKVHWQ